MPENLPSEALQEPAASTGVEGEGKLISNRYQVVRPLGHGGMGTVYLVRDLQNAERLLALKQVKMGQVDKRKLTILKNEFLSLTSLPHPNLARVYDFGVDREGGDVFFTSEFVDGLSWTQAVENLDLRQRTDFEVFLEILAQLLRALEFIHCRGLVHRDIKPGNVLVTGAGQGGQTRGQELCVKLIDFGLVKREKAAGGEKILGTPYYVAPETILGSSIDRRTDLYSLGVVLYQLTTGELPFRGDSSLTILKAHVEKRPVPPGELAPQLSPELCAIILRLMEKDPADRFQSSLELIEQLNRSFRVRLPLETPATILSHLETATLVGREGAQEALRNAVVSVAAASRLESDLAEDLDLGMLAETLGEPGIAGARAPSGRLVVLRGEKGLGKRRLAEELRRVTQIQGGTFLEVECAGVATDGESFARFAGALEVLAGAGDAGRVPLYLENALLLRRDLLEQGGREEEETRKNLLDAVGAGILEASEEQLIVLHLHDVHLAGKTLVDLLQYLVNQQVDGAFPHNQLLVTVTALDHGEVEVSPFQQASCTRLLRANSLELKLERLDRVGVGQLIRSAFAGSDFPRSFVDKVFEESDGNPELVIEILRLFIRRERIRRLVSGWGLSAGYDREELPGNVRRELRDRLQRLPEEVLRLAMAFACLGDVARPDLAAKLAAVPPKTVARSLACLKKEKVIQPVASSENEGHAFLHTSARDILYEMIPEAERLSMHESAGALVEEHLASGTKERARALAHHYLRARNREKGLRYGVEAARLLARESAFAEAIEIYERLLPLAGAPGGEPIAKIEREIAELRFQVGEYRAVFDLLKPLCAGGGQAKGGESCAVYVLAARSASRLGRFEEAESLLDAAEKTCCEPSSQAEQIQHLRARAEHQFFRGNLVESLRCCGKMMELQKGIKDVVLLCQLSMLQAENSSLLNDRETAASYCQAALRRLDAQHDPRLSALTLLCRGKFFLYKHQYAKALRQLQLCRLLLAKTSVIDGQADCLGEIGAIHLLLGSPKQARPHLEEALALHERSGNLARMVATRCALGEVYRQLGEYEASHRAFWEGLRGAGGLEKRRITMQASLSLAAFALDRGDIASVESHLKKAKAQDSRGAGTSGGAVKAYALMSELAFQTGDVESALGYAATGALAARENGDPVLLARLLAQQSLEFCWLGKSGEARRDLVAMNDISGRHELHLCEGWARLLEAMALVVEGNAKGAESGFAQAADLLLAHGSERDLVQLYLERGLWCIQGGSHEQAYLNLEEGLYLAKKLKLAYFQCRYHLAQGLLEVALREGSDSRAEESFRRALGLAEKNGYLEVEWRIRHQLGLFLAQAGRGPEARAMLQAALTSLGVVLRNIPTSYREPYLRFTGAPSLQQALAGIGQPEGEEEMEGQAEAPVVVM